MKKIWVTGAKGQLGTELYSQHSKLRQCEFLFTDIEEMDLTQKKAVMDFVRNENPDVIINCAAYTAVDKAEEEPEKAFLLNRDIPAYLTEAAASIDALLIHLSTDYVFDGTKDRPYTENDRPNPISAYAESKYAGEREVLKNPKNIILRTSWLYSAQGTNFLKTMLRLGKEKEELTVVNDQFGIPTSATDLAGALLYMVKHILSDKEDYGGIYHYSDEGWCSWYDFAVEIMRLTGLNCHVKPVTTAQYPLPAKRPMYSVMDKSKIKRVFGIEIPEWRESLLKVLKTIYGESQ